MTEAIPRETDGLHEVPIVPEVLARLRSKLESDAVVRSGAEVLQGWYTAIRNPAVQGEGLTLVHWSALLPDGGQRAFEDATLPDADHAAYAAMLRPRGHSGPVDFAAAAEAGLDLLFAAGSEAEVNRAHAVLALAGPRIADRERAREPLLALAILEQSVGRGDVAGLLMAPLREDGVVPFMQFPKRMQTVGLPELQERLSAGWAGLTEGETDRMPRSGRGSDVFGNTGRLRRSGKRKKSGSRAEEAAPAPARTTAPPRTAPARTTGPRPPESEAGGETAPEPAVPAGPSRVPAPGGDADAPPLGETGTVLFNPPERMKVGQPERIEVRLGDAGTSLDALKEKLVGRGVPQSETIEIGSRMRVRLQGDPADFEIRALSHEDQLIRTGQPARWDFDVIPKRDGKRSLRLLVSLRMKVGSSEEVVDLPALEREIVVEVSPWFTVRRFVTEHWKWLVTALVVPVLLWLGSKVADYWTGG